MGGRDRDERDDRGYHVERERDHKGRLERERRERTAERGADRKADEVQRHRDRERATEPRRIGAALTQGEEDDIERPGRDADEHHDERDREQAWGDDQRGVADAHDEHRAT